MIWIILAALGVPIWLVVGMLGAALWSRRKFRAIPGVFPCKVKRADDERWPRTTTYALWVHDVLLIHGGPALVKTVPIGVTGIERGRTPAPDVKLKGGNPVSISFRSDDASVFEVAVPSGFAATLAGPFPSAAEGN
jgi:hypothetical protein